MLSTTLTAVALTPVLVAAFAGQPALRGGVLVVPSQTQQSAPPAPDRAPASQLSQDSPPTKETKDPYARLFTELSAARQAVSTQGAGNTKVLCGLTLVEVDPNIDPKIIVPAKPSDVDHKIRRISPTVCRK